MWKFCQFLSIFFLNSYMLKVHFPTFTHIPGFLAGILTGNVKSSSPDLISWSDDKLSLPLSLPLDFRLDTIKEPTLWEITQKLSDPLPHPWSFPRSLVLVTGSSLDPGSDWGGILPSFHCDQQVGVCSPCSECVAVCSQSAHTFERPCQTNRQGLEQQPISSTLHGLQRILDPESDLLLNAFNELPFCPIQFLDIACLIWQLNLCFCKFSAWLTN